jgi:hypothetical protein
MTTSASGPGGPAIGAAGVVVADGNVEGRWRATAMRTEAF